MLARLCFIAYKAKIWLGVSPAIINWLESCPNSTKIWLARFPASICAGRSKKRPVRKNPFRKGFLRPSRSMLCLSFRKTLQKLYSAGSSCFA